MNHEQQIGVRIVEADHFKNVSSVIRSKDQHFVGVVLKTFGDEQKVRDGMLDRLDGDTVLERRLTKLH